MRIGILQTGYFPDELQPNLGDYPEIFGRLLNGHGFTYRTWAVVDGEIPDTPQDADGWLITGSKHGVYEDHAWLPPLEDFIRQVYADGNRPMVGICFGHQVIAKALGGRAEKFDGGWSLGRKTYQIEGSPVALNAWHQDQVIEPPAGAETVGSSEFCQHAALLYDDRIFTVQPHPEFGPAELEGLIRTRGANLPTDLRDAAEAALSEPIQNAEFGNRIARFLLERR